MEVPESELAALAKLADAALWDALPKVAARYEISALDLYRQVDAMRLTLDQYARTLKLRALSMQKTLTRPDRQELATLERKVALYESPHVKSRRLPSIPRSVYQVKAQRPRRSCGRPQRRTRTARAHSRRAARSRSPGRRRGPERPLRPRRP